MNRLNRSAVAAVLLLLTASARFYYRGIHQNVLDTLSRNDVVWVSRLMSRLSDRQWNDAFRGAGYSDDHTRRFVAKIKSKVSDGLKLGEA